MSESPVAVSAVILAGGENRRMIHPKAFIKIGGVSIIERQAAVLWGRGAGNKSADGGLEVNGEGGAECASSGPLFDELIVIAKDPAPYEAIGLKALPDAPEFSAKKSPLVGIYTGLKAVRNDFALIVACDMPFISGKLARRLADLRHGHDAVVPVIGEYREPLFTVYSKTVIGRIKEALEGGMFGLHRVFNGLDVLYVSEEELRACDPELLSFVNVNTPEELEIAEGLARQRQKGRF